MKEIRLTQGKVALVDDEDFEYLNKIKWYVSKTKTNFYAANDKIGLMHRFILKSPRDKITDHKDHNGLNNQKYNIRICTYSQNAQNRISKLNGNSHFLGVTKIINKKKYKNRIYIYQYYMAQITVKGKQKTIGMYKSEIQAAKTYNNAALKHHGDFANLNIIE